ncbi:unannotated protein [freshwater metagenome]|jgi:phytoene desaturase|uniref:Unannotated protein n=1 Tax=freshwater metagenome TaxID=449393 RepID=A0A6J7LNH1_9ZZZZ|nr:phytoene desaturase [Actinomycetota bacterium]MSV86425.1 phytoene desaturase [Actinomycetota bacterium]MSW67585.1 phytoene desaturase [Actinomycetota bacterium]MSX28362.1 phytoene desaturase [Actinomycetota bacterium]MSY03709.1 phytoene desaturase [Actinomycetota bacterium]
MSRIVVIGAGIGGMCAAARLAKLGHSVDVFEGSDQVGGKCRTEWIGKYAFDTGPSLLTLPAVYRDFFLKTGEPIEKVLELQPVNPSFDYKFADGSEVNFTNLSRHETLTSLSQNFGENVSTQWKVLMERAEKMWDVSREPFIESELTSPLSLLKRPTLLRDLFTIAPWKSLRELVRSVTDDEHLSYIIDRYATYSGSDPRKAPAVLLSIAFVEEAFGAWHIKGGIGQLALAIEERAKKLGVKFHVNSPVSSINHNGKKVSGITLNSGEKVTADVVVANADASTVYTHLISEKVRVLRRQRKSLAQSEPSLAGFSLLLGLKPDSEAPAMNHHTVLFPADYDAEFDSIFTHYKPVEEPTIYICAPRDESMSRTPGYESWFVLVNAPRHSTIGEGFDWSDENFARAYASKIISQIEARGIPLRNRIELLEVRTPADLEKSIGTPGGSIYGSSSNSARSAFMRARNRSPLKGLFCVGGSAHPGGGLPLVGISAEIVADAIGRA